jgi:tetratricopeptide (TPR) repeat protein
MLNGLYDLAMADFDVVIDDNDDHGSAGDRLAEAYYQRGLVRAMRKEMSAAVRDFSRAIGTVPYRAEVYEARAAVYEFLGKTRNAQQDREEAELRRARPPS